MLSSGSTEGARAVPTSTFSCRACDLPLTAPLRRLSEGQWTAWAERFTAAVPYTAMATMPLVPFGCVARLHPDTPSPPWGPWRVNEPMAFGDLDPQALAFLPPGALRARVDEGAPVSCCGVSAYDGGPETLLCACGAGVGWIHDDCWPNVRFERLNLARVREAEGPPQLGGMGGTGGASGPDPRLLSLARASTFRPGAPRDGDLWDLYQLYAASHMVVPAGPGIFWISARHAGEAIRFYEGDAEAARGWDLNAQDAPLPEASFEVSPPVWEVALSQALAEAMATRLDPEG